MVKLLEWFDQHDLFNVEVSSLKSVFIGLTAIDEEMVNCDQAEENEMNRALGHLCAHIG